MSYIGTYELTHMKFLNRKRTIEEIVSGMDEVEGEISVLGISFYQKMD